METFLDPRCKSPRCLRRSQGLTTPFALAQAPDVPQPPVPSVTSDNEARDSGVGDLDTTEWVGKPVTSSDGQRVGTLREVRMASDTADAGILIIDRKGGEAVEVPMQGASFDGSNVVATPLMSAIVTN